MVKHTDWNICKWCKNFFPSRLEMEAHKCLAPKHICPQCGKRFVHREHLNRHAKLHANPKPIVKKTKKKASEEKPTICEKCGDVFKNPHSLKQHLRSHGKISTTKNFANLLTTRVKKILLFFSRREKIRV